MNLHDQTESCACSSYRASRRSMLKGLGLTAGALTLSSTTDGVFRQVAFADSADPDASRNDNTLIVLSLRGGVDGMSLVVPYGDPGYLAARPKIGIPATQLLARDGFFGLHPSFAPLMPMWNQGKFAAIQAVGLPQPNRSHFEAMEDIEEADPGSSARVGWLNRMVGQSGTGQPTDAVQMGSAIIPTELYGPQPVLGIGSTASVKLTGAMTGDRSSWKRNALNAMWSHDASPLGSGAQSALEATVSMANLVSHPSPQSPAAQYPSSPFAATMKDTARLLKGGLGVKVVTVDYGSWDMHVGLGTLSNGLMTPMVNELASTLAAFFTDIASIADKVTLVTISEFGRRAGENANAGLDHGWGNVMMAMGAGVKGGQIYGAWPGLDQSDLVNGDLAVTRDYRSVLTELLRARTSVDTTTVFPDFVADQALGFMA